MQILNHFLELRASFEHGIEHKPQAITLEEIAARLYCSTRNVKLLLKKMCEQQWISWKPGRGRGNVSELTFLVSAEDMIAKQAMELASSGDYKGSIELIHQLGKGEALQDSFVEWLFGFFGYKTVEHETRLKDTLRFPVYKWIVTLDPAQCFYAFDFHMMNQIFDTLVQYNSQKKVIEPHLAHYWQVSREGLHYTFYLRKGVLFHHGREMTAQDVLYSLERLQKMGEAACQGWMTAGIESLSMLNRYALTIELKQPNVLFLQQLAHSSMAVVPEEIYKDHVDIFGRMPIGTGPFRLERNDDYICKLSAFDSYFGVRPQIDQIELWRLPMELSEAQQSWERVQVLVNMETNQKPVGAVGKDAEWHQIKQSIMGCSLLTFNQNRQGPQRQLAFRQAINLILDREGMIQELGGFREAPARSFLPDRNMDYGPALQTDVERAKRLLAEIGYKGERLRMYVYGNNTEDAAWIRKQSGKAGIPVDIIVRSEADMMKLEVVNEADFIFYHICMESNYDLHIIQTLKEANSYVRAHLEPVEKKRVDEAIDRIMMVPDEEMRIALLHELVEELQASKSFLFVLHRSQQTTYHDSVKGLSINDLGWVDFRKIWFTPTG
ncbi:ABC transporter substrate-binding protein [Paenibacillus oryzisoli]|uniref:ABC transporter substrate-binding protein n=1 Tax=Paenibacillus oryzisoli TaxID=1850517 RepID=UPI003D27ABAC